MKKINWRVKLGLGLVAASAVLMVVHYLIFRDLHHLAIYGFHEIAMMPIEVLFVTMILHSLLERRARQEMLQKLNMVIGAFFSEVGSGLLHRISALDETVEVREHFLVSAAWDARRYETARKAAAAYDYDVQATPEDLRELRTFIVEKRAFLLGLLQNPNLLEHKSFTDALWAIFHLSEELEHRSDFAGMPESDRLHLTGDIKRAYAALAGEWLDYAQHLQTAYPYLFSLAVRTNPLDSNATVTVSS
ncbi:MAG: hypothetical protein Q8K99_11210 [Actinomycetota bacterium]|nr:hypothetical protein [Actinomycetota bacterium]